MIGYVIDVGIFALLLLCIQDIIELKRRTSVYKDLLGQQTELLAEHQRILQQVADGLTELEKRAKKNEQK